MARMRGIVLVLLTVGFVTPILFLMVPRASACSCEGKPPVSVELEWSGLVFRGIAKSIDDDDLSKAIIITFDVLTVWKGEIAKELTVFTGHGGGDCGYLFHEGVEYIVYASPDTGGVGICGRTAPIWAAGDDLRELGPGTEIDYGGNPPTAYDPADRTPLGEKTWVIPILATLIAGALALVWLVMNRLGPRLS